MVIAQSTVEGTVNMIEDQNSAFDYISSILYTIYLISMCLLFFLLLENTKVDLSCSSLDIYQKFLMNEVEL